MREPGYIGQPAVCDCGHLQSVHPCKGSGAWTNPIEPEPLVWIDKHTAIQVLRHCLCKEFK